ncbi:MAG: aminotransferase class V-fold PLP-dependent enzyme [Cyclobacteriaceae bacterium]
MMDIDWKKIRSNYPVLDKCTYLNTASSGAISKGTAEVMKTFAEDQLNNATLNRSNWIATIEESRNNTAKLINAAISEVAFTPDVSIAMSFTAQALGHKKTVAILEDEFPSVVLPWISHAYDISWIKRAEDHSFDLSDFEKAIVGGTHVVIISWVHYNSGITTDLETLGQLCKEHGAILVVDATQGLGAIPMDVKKYNISILMASTFKWLTGGYGTCVMYVSDEIQSALHHKAMGWNSLVDFGMEPTLQSNWKTGAPSFELGHLKYLNLITFGQALKELQETGIQNINQRIESLREYLINSLGQLDKTPILRETQQVVSGIITVAADIELQKWLTQQNIIITYRENYIRLSVHFYNDFEDVDRLASAISGYSPSKLS